MKDTFENNIKSSLENHELPFNPKAWDAMKARLDTQSPALKAPRSKFKPYAAVATIAIASVASYFYFTQDSPEAVNPAPHSEMVANENGVETVVEQGNEVNQQVENSTPQTVINTPRIGNNVAQTEQISTIVNNPFTSDNSVTYTIQKDQLNENTSGTSGNKPSGNTATDKKKIILPTVPTMCENDTYTIANGNAAVILVLLYPDGTPKSIQPKTSLIFEAEVSGKYKLGYNENNLFVERHNFIVNPAPQVNFNVDNDTKFENGLPATKVSSATQAQDYTWQFDKSTVVGQEAIGHFYTKGNHTISLSITGLNGCKAKALKTIHVESDYNLMAPNALNPNDSDPRARVFIPYALTERDVKFKMIIVDKEGRLVFETSDANNPWDGIDMKNGKEVDGTTVYFWKVILENPEPGESPNYSGLVTRI